MIATKRLTITHKPSVFFLIWGGQLISLIGSGLTGFALRVWVYLSTGSVTEYALIAFFTSLPGLLISPMAGALIDRWDRRWAMILSDIGAALSTLTLWVLLKTSGLQNWHIYLAATFSSLCAAFQVPAYSAVTTLLVPKEHLGRANGVIQLGPAATQILAPLLAGILVMNIEIEGVILIDLVTFVFALVSLLIVEVPKPETSAHGQEARGSFWHEARYGLKYIKERPGLWGLMLFFAGINFTLGLVIVLILPLVLSFTTASVLGIILSISGVGMLLGGLAMGLWGGPRRRISGVLGFAFLCGAILLLGGMQPSAPLVALASFIFLFCYQIVNGCAQTIWQKKVSPDIQGRVFAAQRMVAQFTGPLARLVSGPLSDDIFEPLLAANGLLAGSVGGIIGTGPGRGIGFLFIVLGVITILMAAGAYAYPRIRQVEDELPDAAAEQDKPASGEVEGERVKGARRRRRWPLYVAAALLTVAALLVAALVWFVRRPWPQVNGTLAVAGLQAPVEVIRDDLGVPHIYAQNEHDLFFAQGYVHAQDRLWQMEWNRRTASGTLSAIVGDAGLSTDRYLRTLGLRRVAEQSWPTLDDETRTILQAYADGVNAYIDTHRGRLPLEFTFLGVKPEPWTPIDTLAWGNGMSIMLSGNLRFEIVRMHMIAEVGEQVTQQLFPPFARDMPLIIPHPVGQYQAWRGARFETLDEVDEWLGDPTLGWGSNNWVVHGDRTASGLPILANDTHLGMQMPSIWYENGLHGGRFDGVGFTFPGSPAIVIGHNRYIAWGTTNLGPDTQDLYLEKLDDPQNPTRYEFMGQWYDLERIQETIEIKGKEPETLNILLTRHGPLMNDVAGTLEDDDAPLSLRWTLSEGNKLVQSLVHLNLATNWDEFRDALRDWDLPSQNFVYADVYGNIGYQAPGRIPVRTPVHQGTLPVPGWTGEYEWQGYIPFDELPYDLNPPAGYIATANNKITDDSYPYTLTHDWFPGYRARRIGDLLAASTSHTLESMQYIHAQTYSLPAEALRPYMLAITPENDQQAQAIDLLKEWDLYFETDRVGASIYETWYIFTVRNTVGDELGEDQEDVYLAGRYQRHGTQHVPFMIELMAEPDNAWFDDVNTPEVETRDDILRRGLADALDWLSERYGKNPEGWNWGRMHTVTFEHSPIGANQSLAYFFNSSTVPARGDPFTVDAAGFSWNNPFEMVHGSSQRMVVDMSDLDNSVSILTTGQTMQVFHPHRDDMIPLWQNVEYHAMPFSRDAVDAIAEDVLTLEPK
jgi:penicillin amidase